MGLTIPVRFVDGVGNVPAAANWNDDFDWLTGLALGTAFLSNGGQEKWSSGTTFTNPSNGTVLSDNWTEVKSGTSPCTADVTREASVIDTGLYSMKVNITGAGSSDSYWAITQSLNNPSGFGSQTLLAGCRIKVATANKVRIKIYDGTTTVYSSYHTGDGTWQLLQAKLAAAASPSQVTMTIEINPANFTDAVYMDSAYVYVVPSAISARAQAALVYSPLADAGVFLPLSGGTMTGPIAMGSHKITGLTNGSSAQDAAAFGQIPTVTNWASYTPTIGGAGTPTNVSFFWKQIGDSIYVKGTFTTGTQSGNASISLPNSTAINYSKTSTVGQWHGLAHRSSQAAFNMPQFSPPDGATAVVFSDGSDTAKVYATYLAAFTKGGWNSNSGDAWTVMFDYPI